MYGFKRPCNFIEFLECKRGDVLILEKKFGQLKPNDVIFVENTRTGYEFICVTKIKIVV